MVSAPSFRVSREIREPTRGLAAARIVGLRGHCQPGPERESAAGGHRHLQEALRGRITSASEEIRRLGVAVDRQGDELPPTRLVVFGIEELPEDLWSFATYLIAGFVWQLVRRRPNRQRLLVVDEAWLLLQHRDGARFLESIARLARSYGLGLVFITQDVKNVLGDARGSVIVENLFTTVLFRQSSKGPAARRTDAATGERALRPFSGRGAAPGAGGAR